jgi:hypothetical protein
MGNAHLSWDEENAARNVTLHPDRHFDAARESAAHTGAGIHQVLVGGESGAGYRPMNMEWARSLRDRCVAVGVAYFQSKPRHFAPGAARTWARKMDRAGSGNSGRTICEHREHFKILP